MSKTRENRTRILEEPVGMTLIRLTVPMIFGILSMVIYNLTDTFYVGRLGREQLAALSFTFPVVLTVASLAQGIGMGAAAAVSRAIGGEDYRRVRRLAADSLVLGLLVVGLGALVGRLTIGPLFSLLGARGTVLEYTGEYMRVWYVGMVFVVVPMVGNSIIRATGDTKTPGLIMMLGALVNFIMDPLLIFGIGPFPALGIRGAAIATVCGRSFTFLTAMYVLVVREKLLAFEVPRIRELLASWREVMHVGLPNAGTRMIIPLGNGFITRVIAGYGAAAVAGYGVATRIEFFSLAALNALAAVIGPFIGQNLGAGKPERVRTGFTVSGYFSLLAGGVLFLLYLPLAGRIAAVFNADPQVTAAAALYLRIVSAAYAAQGFYLVAAAGLNVLRRPFEAAGLSLLQMFGLSVPLALLGSRVYGIPGVFAAVGVSYAVTGLVSILAVRKAVL